MQQCSDNRAVLCSRGSPRCRAFQPQPARLLGKYPAGLLVTTSRLEFNPALDGTIMDRAIIDLKCKGGSICMAAASAAINRRVLIDLVLNTGRQASWLAFSQFYNRARISAMAQSIGLAVLA